MNRRSFLKTSIVSAVGLAIAPALVAKPEERWIDLHPFLVEVPAKDMAESCSREGVPIEFVEKPLFMRRDRLTAVRSYTYPIKVARNTPRIRYCALVRALSYHFQRYSATHLHSVMIMPRDWLGPIDSDRFVMVRTYHNWREMPPELVGLPQQRITLSEHEYTIHT